MAPSTTFLALRVFDSRCAQILLRRFKGSKVWTFPLIILPKATDDPYTHIPRVLKELVVSPDFEFISAVPIVKYDHTESVWNERVHQHLPQIFRSYIYHLQYNGKVSPILPGKVREDYDTVQWVLPSAISKLGPANRPLGAYLKAIEKEPTLT